MSTKHSSCCDGNKEHAHKGCCGGHHDHGHGHHHDHGHTHHHDHGHTHQHGSNCCGKHKSLPKEHTNVLLGIAHTTYLPVVQFVMKSTKSEHFESVALAPVFLLEPEDSMEEVKYMANLLNEMEENGLITIDYDIPLDNYDYSEYENSAVYKYFKKTMEESAQKEEFVFDIASINKGSIAMTEKGLEICEHLHHH